MAGPFPLHVGVVSHESSWEDHAPPAVDYSTSVDESRRYPLILYHGTLKELAGSCHVRKTDAGGLEVDDFQVEGVPLEFSWDLADSRFYGSFSADEDGKASLDEVLLVVRQP